MERCARVILLASMITVGPLGTQVAATPADDDVRWLAGSLGGSTEELPRTVPVQEFRIGPGGLASWTRDAPISEFARVVHETAPARADGAAVSFMGAGVRGDATDGVRWEAQALVPAGVGVEEPCITIEGSDLPGMAGKYLVAARAPTLEEGALFARAEAAMDVQVVPAPSVDVTVADAFEVESHLFAGEIAVFCAFFFTFGLWHSAGLLHGSGTIEAGVVQV